MFARLATVVAVLAMSVVVVQSPAAAAFSDCTSGIGCVWRDANGGGAKMNIAVGAFGVNSCHNFDGLNGWDNSVSSATNTYGAYGSQQLWLFLYTNGGCSGTAYGVAPFTVVNFGSPYDNAFTSFKIIPV